MKEAGQVGSVVHSLVEDYLKGEKIPNQVYKRFINCWNLFLAWWEQQEYDPIHIEKKLYSKKFQSSLKKTKNIYQKKNTCFKINNIILY